MALIFVRGTVLHGAEHWVARCFFQRETLWYSVCSTVVLCVLTLTPDNPFNIIGITKNDAYHFIRNIGHGVVGYRSELRNE